MQLLVLVFALAVGLDERLLDAAKRGDTESCLELLARGANERTLDPDGKSALTLAVFHLNSETALALVRAGVPVDLRSDAGRTALMWAATSGQTDVAAALIDAGANVNARADDGWTPLGLAAGGDYAETATLLVERGAVNVGNALTAAVSRNRASAVRALIEAGVSPSVTNEIGDTGLWVAAIDGHGEIVRVLLEAGADTEAKTEDGQTALFYAVDKKRPEIVRALLDAGADVNVADENGQTPLLLAAFRGNETNVAALIDAGAQVDVRSRTSPLIMASQEGHTGVVRRLLDAGADANLATDGGWTALMEAASDGHEDIVRVLVERGADVDAHYSRGYTAEFVARRYGYPNVAAMLETSLPPPEPADDGFRSAMIAAASRGRIERMRELIGLGADVNLAADAGRTPLLWAAERGELDAVVFLLEAGARMDVTDREGWSPLVVAAGNNHPAVVEALIDAGADIHATDGQGQTALHWLSYYGQLSLVTRALDAGIDVNARDINNEITALMAAVQEGRLDVVEELLAHGADPYLVEYPGRMAPPFSSAIAYGHFEIARAILGAGWLPQSRPSNDVMDLFIRSESATRVDSMWSALDESPDLLERLLQRGADPRARTDRGVTALMLAAKYDRTSNVRLLLEAGADVHAETVFGATALFAAVKRNSIQSAELLLAAGAEVEITERRRLGRHRAFTPLTWAAGFASDETLFLLLDHHADPNRPRPDGVTALMAAARSRRGRNASRAKRLLEEGADGRARDRNGMTALLWAVVGTNRPVVEVLLEAGADPHARDRNGQGALHFAATRRDRRAALEIAQLLVARSVEDAPDRYGQTALDWAKRYDARELIALLQTLDAAKDSP